MHTSRQARVAPRPCPVGGSTGWWGPALAGLLLSFPAASDAFASTSNWPGWRGPHANGATSTGTYPVRWSASDVAWKVALPGKGSSTPIAWNDRIYLTTPSEGEDAVLAFDLSGKQLWVTRLGPATPPKHRTLGSSSNASPVTDGASLFVYFKSGHFAALDLDGAVRWKTNLAERFGEERLFWDAGGSPVVTDRHVVLARLHGGESWLAGFDKATGELRWKQARDYRTPTENNNAYNTPVVFEEHGRTALLVWGADHLTAHDAANGTLVWSCGGFNPDGTGFWPAIASPVIAGDLAIVPVGRDDRQRQSRVHAIRLGGQGDVTATHRVWQRDDLGVFVSSPALHDGRVYLLRHRGEVVCLDPATGRTLWSAGLPEHRTPFYASPLLANGVFYAAREDGTVFAARVQDGFQVLGENPMGERIVASPVPVANRLILLRGDEHLFCIAAK